MAKTKVKHPWDCGGAEPTADQLTAFWAWAQPKLKKSTRDTTKKIRTKRLEQLKWLLIEAWIDTDSTRFEAVRRTYLDFEKAFIKEYPEEKLPGGLLYNRIQDQQQ